MKVFSVFGITNSGKTTTVDNIVMELRRRGYSVATAKEMYHEGTAMNTEDTSITNHKDAGAEIIITRKSNETNILLKRRLNINEILSFYSQDYIVLEDIVDTDIPKILCATKEAEIIEQIDDTVIAISGVISKSLILFNNSPAINSITDIDILVDLIEEKVMEYDKNKENE